MKIENWYRGNFEALLSGRYITLKMVKPILDNYNKKFKISIPGFSEEGQEIKMIKIGSGQKKVLAWSQMHGNESTTTKAIFDLVKFFGQTDFFQKEIQEFLKTHSLYIIPILNPDGAENYTRENANGVDLNRDAQALTQLESKCLRAVFNELQPHLCLNLHDQRTIYGFDSGLPATISFLSPAANVERSITKARMEAMEGIVKMNNYLQKITPGQVGRYEDSFNAACVGDTFQMAGVPTILFEAGHYNKDYQREKSREFIFYSLLVLFGIIDESENINYKDYFKIPENIKNYRDLIIRNTKLIQYKDSLDIAIQYVEVFRDKSIVFESIIDDVGNLGNLYGHVEIDANSLDVLTNSHNKLTIGDQASDIVKKYGDFTNILS